MAASSSVATKPTARVDSNQTCAPNSIVLINPAFLQEMKDSNPQLWQTRQQLTQLCHADHGKAEQSIAQVVGKFVRTLDQFRDDIALQFALEESYGYQSVAGTPNPSTGADRISKAISTELVQTAKTQHRSLYLHITELAEQAEELQYRGGTAHDLAKLIDNAQAFEDKFDQHEELENDLIDQAFDLS